MAESPDTSAGESLGRRFVRLLCYALYYGVARHLPYSPRPYAFGARRIRYLLCRQMLGYCGENVNIEHGALINDGRNIRIGDNSGIGLDNFVSGPLVMGDNVITGPFCTFLGLERDTSRTDVPMRTQPYLPTRPPVIDDDVWIGANVVVYPGCHIGRGAIVAAGAVVTSDIPAYAVAAGNPARVIKDRQAADAGTAYRDVSPALST